MDFILCPECGAENKLEAVHCATCSADLSAVKSLIDTANEHYNEALALAHSGKLDEAIGQVEAALSMNAQNPNYYNLLGTLHAQKGLFSESIRAWERCLALDPEMEKAYHNIEKAQDMEGEYAEEQSRRPFLLATIASGVAASLLLVITLYLGISLYFKGSQVDDLQTRVANLNTNVTKYKSELDAFQAVLPKDGVSGLLMQMEGFKTQITEKDKQIADIQAQHELILRRREETTQRTTTLNQELRNQITDKDKELQELNSLRTVINSNNHKIESLEKELEDAKTMVALEQERVTELREKLKLAQDTSNSIREDKERAIATLKTANETLVEDMRQKISMGLDEIGKLARHIEDMKYASDLVVESLKNIDANQFDLALTNAQKALNHAPELSAAAYVHKEVQNILADPLEKVRRFEEARLRREQEAKKSLEYAKDYLNRAGSSFKSGNFDEAVIQAKLAVDLVEDETVKKEGNNIIKSSEEKKVQLMTIMQDAKLYIEKQEIQKAENELRKILKISPNHSEAQQLLDQITAKTS